MEEHKNHNKVSRIIILLVIAVTIIIALLGYLMYSQKVAADKQITDLKRSEAELEATVAELQGKLDNISDIADTGDESEKNTSTSVADETSSTSFTDEQVKECLANYLELRYAIGTEVLTALSKKGALNYNESDNTEINYETHTKVKFTDYKKAMLNYVSEKEFEKNFDSKLWRKIDDNGYFTVGDGIGGPSIDYTVKNVTKTNDTSYTSQTSYVEGGNDAVNQNFSFTIKNYNGHCVIDSITE